jgi:integrase/recombinase XerD
MQGERLALAYVARMRAAGYSAKTIAHRSLVIAQFARHIGGDPSGAQWTHCADWLASTDGGAGEWSQGTKVNYHRTLRAWFAFLVLVGEREDNPMDKLARPKPPAIEDRSLYAEAVERILARELRPRTEMMVILAAYQGLRVHEIAKIRGEDFDERGQLTVRGKGGSIGKIHVHPMVSARLCTFPTEGYWFPSYRYADRPVTAHAVGITIKTQMRAAGVKGTAHCLRHWYGTQMLRRGSDLRTVQVNLRHASISSTQRYTNPDDDQRRAAINSLPMPA